MAEDGADAAILLELAPGAELEVRSAGGPGEDRLVVGRGAVRLTQRVVGAEADVWRELATGRVEEQALYAALPDDPPGHRLEWAAFVLRLVAGRILKQTLVLDGQPALTRRVVSPAFRSTPYAPERAWVLSRFTHLRRDGGELVLESPRSHWRVVPHSSAALEALRRLARPLAPGQADPVVRFLAEAGMLSPVEDGTAAEDRDDDLRAWEFHDLLFHDRSRRGRHEGRVGGTMRLSGQVEPLPVRRPAAGRAEGAVGENAGHVVLPVPEPAGSDGTAPGFDRVLEQRRSGRPEGAQITLRQLAEVLYRACRAQRVDEEAGVSWRPYPTGGAIGELEVYVAAERCAGLPPGLYRYDSLDHRLDRVAGSSGPTARLLDAAATSQGRDGRPAVLLVLASRFRRVSWKYEGIAYALVLKNAGALLQTLQLVATRVGVASCAIGTGSNADFAAATGLPEHVEGPLAEITLG